MVRLKVCFSQQCSYLSWNFNSTMVRLKEAIKLLQSIKTEFQFHYGTIKSAGTLLQLHSVAISIPLWYD